MNQTAFRFLMLGIISVVIGMVWGIQMSMTHDHSLSPAHAHLNLLGWVTFGIMAMYYQLVPRAAASRLAMVHFALAVVGLVLIVPGIALALTGVTEALAAIGSIVTLAAMLVFGAVVWANRTAPAA